MRRVVSSRKMVPTKETKWVPVAQIFASFRVFSGQKKSGAASFDFAQGKLGDALAIRVIRAIRG